MKNRLLLFCLAICLLDFSANAQIKQLNSSSRTVTATIDVASGSLDNVRLSQQTPAQGFVQDISLELESAELLISYSLKPTVEEQFYHLRINIQLNGEEITPSPVQLKGRLGDGIRVEDNVSGNIVWTDILEQYLNLEGELVVTLTAELWGKPILPFNIDCEVMPEFKLQWAHYIAAAVGAGAIGAGFLLGNQADDIYNNDYLTAPTEETAEPHFQNANDKRHQGIILKYSGAGLLLIDAVWYTIRYIRYKNRLEAFNEYCTQNSVTLSPAHIKTNYDTGGQSAHLGLKLTYNF